MPKGKGGKKQSAFRAVKTVDQPLPALNQMKVLYQQEQFDLNQEYDEASSTFVPKRDGIYTLTASILFSPTVLNDPSLVQLSIRVNNTNVATERSFAPALENFIFVTTIVELKAGDQVEVSAVSFGDGAINTSSSTTHFEGARLD